jgi:nucleoside-diphosphate-sugar epimerase
MSAKVAIFGASGAVGRNTAGELLRRGIPFAAVGRNEAKLQAAFGGGDIRPANLADTEAAERAAAGCDTVLYCVGLPYPDFGRHPELMKSSLQGASRAGVRRMVVVSSVYGYGRPQTPRVAESHPRNPAAWKGQMRRQQEDLALAAHQAGSVHYLVLRPPDFYGPYADISLAHMIFQAALEGKPAQWLGSVDLPHEFIYMPDAAEVIAELLLRDDLDGAAWNLGGPGTITAREFIGTAFEAAGHRPRWRTANRLMLRVAGLFSPMMRQLQELFYLFEAPVVLDDSALAARLGPLPKTPYTDGIRRTIDFMKTGSTMRKTP